MIGAIYVDKAGIIGQILVLILKRCFHLALLNGLMVKKKIIVKAMYGLTEMEIHDALDDLLNEFKIILKKYYDKH